MSLRLCDFCYEYLINLEDVKEILSFSVLTSLSLSEYFCYLEDKNGNIYKKLLQPTATAGELLFETVDSIYSTDFNTMERNTVVYPFQFSPNSDLILTVRRDINDEIDIPMPDGNTYSCIILKFKTVDAWN